MNNDGEVRTLLAMHRPVNCELCGGSMVYDGLGHYSCKRCGHQELDDYGKVRDFLDENENAPIALIESATGVSATFIKKLLDEGMLELSANSPVFLVCQKCGKEIRYGRFCPKCTLSLANELNSSFKEKRNSVGEIIKDKGEGGMHYLGNHRGR